MNSPNSPPIAVDGDGYLPVAVGRRNTMTTRVFLAAVLFAFGTLFTGDFAAPLIWFAAVVVTQGADFLVTVRLLEAGAARRASHEWGFCASTTIAALVWSYIFILLWTQGGQVGQIVAVLSCAGSMLHVAVVCYHSPRLFWLMISPYAFALIGPLVGASIARGDVPMIAGLGLLAAVLGFIANFFASYKQLRAMTLRVEAARAEAESRRVEADRANAAKSAFLATMSHELRTPLNAVIGYAELLEEELAERGESADDAARISLAGRHLLSLINDVLDLSKIEAGRLDVRPSPFALRACVDEIASTLAQGARAKGNTLEIECGADEICITDQTLLRQCLFNLLSNANKFTKDGAVKLRAWRCGAQLSFEVADTGIGMTREQIARLFQPFIQADGSLTREYGGTGLGLAITQRIARLLGGDVSVKSAPGQGSAFTLTINAEAAPALMAA